MRTFILVMVIILILLILFYNINVHDVENFITLNGLNPLRSFPSKDTLHYRFYTNLLPYYNSTFWDLNDLAQDTIEPPENNNPPKLGYYEPPSKTIDNLDLNYIKYGNRKLKRQLLGSNYIGTNYNDVSYYSNFNDIDDARTVIDPDRTKLNTDVIFQGYNFYNLSE